MENETVENRFGAGIFGFLPKSKGALEKALVRNELAFAKRRLRDRERAVRLMAIEAKHARLDLVDYRSSLQQARAGERLERLLAPKQQRETAGQKARRLAEQKDLANREIQRVRSAAGRAAKHTR